MKYKIKVTLWIILLVVVAVGISWWAYKNSDLSPASEAVIQSNRIVFNCDGNNDIKAYFGFRSVRLKLSDGQHFLLKRKEAASGVRYATKNGDIVFWNKGNTAFMMKNDAMWIKNCVQQGQDDLVNLKSYHNKQAKLNLRYPKALQLDKENVNDTTGWSSSSSEKGMLIVHFTTSPSYQPKTNLVGAVFTVGRSRAPKAVKNCMIPSKSRMIKSDSLKKGGDTFLRSRYTDAGAGNYYQILQYNSLRNQSCYSVEEIVHSTNIHNYPASRNIAAFDSARVWKTLNVPWETLTFGK